MAASAHTPPAGARAPRQQALVTISALAARGDLPRLHDVLAQGLKAGLTVNEEKEELVQLLRLLRLSPQSARHNTLLKVLDERQAQGKHDVVGRAASPITNTCWLRPSTRAASRCWGSSPASPRRNRKPATPLSAPKLTVS